MSTDVRMLISVDAGKAMSIDVDRFASVDTYGNRLLGSSFFSDKQYPATVVLLQ